MEKATVLFLLAVLTFDLRIHQHTESMQRLHKHQRTYVHFEVSIIYVTLCISVDSTMSLQIKANLH